MPATTLLFNALTNLPGDNSILWVADENSRFEAASQVAGSRHLTTISNRYPGPENPGVLFSDYDFSMLAAATFDVIAYRVSKEKPVVHWVMNNCKRLLKPGGRLIITGKKDEGLKGYADKAVKQLGFSGKTVKHGQLYQADLYYDGNRDGETLDDKNYTQLRAIGEAFGFNLLSKPGLYGWNKIDQGSQCLAESFLQTVQGRTTPFKNGLDLGCGYGYLSLAMIQAGVAQVTATDNNAAAVHACTTNLGNTGFNKFSVLADNCAQSVTDAFDLVLCNPPFHQGFDLDSSLTERFVSRAAALLMPGGEAYFVVNAFIGVEKVAARHFTSQETLSHTGSFKVFRFSRPRR